MHMAPTAKSLCSAIGAPRGVGDIPFSDEADPLQASCTGLKTEVDVKDAYGRRQTLAYQSQCEASPCNASWRGAAFSCDAGFRTADNPANHAPCTLRRP
jgi:hypothetical protein